MTAFENWSLTAQFAQVFIGLLQAGLIFYGIRVMDRNATMRAADSEHKHEENMAALKELIAGQEESRAALRALIERTGGEK